VRASHNAWAVFVYVSYAPVVFRARAGWRGRDWHWSCCRCWSSGWTRRRYIWLNDVVGVVTGQVRRAADGDGPEVVIEVDEIVWEPEGSGIVIVPRGYSRPFPRVDVVAGADLR
jgi:hypothetical protein